MGLEDCKPRKSLTQAFKEGRFKAAPTMSFPEIYSAYNNCLIGTLFADADGRRIADCTIDELETVERLAIAEHDTALSNPNVPVLAAALAEMRYLDAENKYRAAAKKAELALPSVVPVLAPVIPIRPPFI